MIGAHTFGFVWRCDAATALKQLADKGFRQFQLLAMGDHLDPLQISSGQLREISRILGDFDGQILAVDVPSSDTNLASPTVAVSEFAVASYARVMEVAHTLGAKWLTINSGRRHTLLPPPDHRLLELYQRSLEQLVRRASTLGMRILIENIPGSLLQNGHDLANFLSHENYGIVDILYDVANAWAVDEDPGEGLAVAAPHLGLVHLSDTNRRQWWHGPVGSGDIDFKSIGSTIIQTGFRGPIVLEVFAEDALGAMTQSRDRLSDLGKPF